MALDAGVIYEETTSTLFCGDLFAHDGNGPALTTSDILGPAAVTSDAAGFTTIGPSTAPIIGGLAKLAPKMLAVMHGSFVHGRCGAALAGLASHYADRLRAALDV